GIYVDLLKAIEESTGIAMVPLLVPTDENIFDWLARGEADYIMCSSRLPHINEDVSGFLGSDPITSYATVAVTRPDYNLDDAQEPVIALTTWRTYLEARIYAQYPDAKITYYSTAKDCMVAVQEQQADATFINSWEYNYQSKNSRFQGMTEWENTRVSADVIVVANAGKNEAWLSIVDKAFHQLTDEERSDIIARNVNMPYSSFDSADRWYAIRENLKPYIALLAFLLCLFCVYLYMRQKNLQALLEKNKELQNANEAKSAFLSRMSHELRTPLNAIAGYAQEQESNCLSASFDARAELQSIASIQRAVRYQQSIIGDLLDIRQIESGRIRLTLEEVEAAAYMDGIVEMIRPEAEARRIDFTYDQLTATNETYLADPVRLQQILLNLLHNAVKFTPEGGTVRLTAQAVRQEGSAVRLRFVVSDTGIGMSKEFIDTKLFKNFAQEHSGTTSPYEGCGIGLATCKELVRLMGGSITCESTQGQGTAFTVEIVVEALPPKKRERKKREPVPCDLQGVHMLLCEDNPMNQEIEKRLLERMGCAVDIAENGAIGCELFSKSAVGSYHMILMDIRMPEMDGLEAARTIRAMQRDDAATVPILAVSANAFDEDVQQSLAAGMNEHLAKPMDVRVIHDRVMRYCFHQG
ncbi:MAG: ATP-binding protein, partial [Eubacteriales bacterium]|nr:ATP-binding protein [Eubacteriales bacterium]